MSFLDFLRQKLTNTAPQSPSDLKSNHADQHELLRIAKTGFPYEDRCAAIAMITDQKVLTEIARDTENHWSARAAAVERLSDPALLADLAKNDNDFYVRGAAAGNIHFTDRTVLAEIAKGDKFEHVRRLALANPALVDGASSKSDENQGTTTDGGRPAESNRVDPDAMVVSTDNNVSGDVLPNEIEKWKKELESPLRFEREVAARKLVLMAQRNPKLLLSDWHSIKNRVEEHTDAPHSDNKPNCPHSDTSHIDIGAGLTFPPFPADLSKG